MTKEHFEDAPQAEELYEIIESNKEVSSKPVAYRHWMIDDEFPEDSCWEYFDAPTGEDCKECIPLYTHPVKQLSDEEWQKFFHANSIFISEKFAGIVARAIIKEITE